MRLNYRIQGHFHIVLQSHWLVGSSVVKDITGSSARQSLKTYTDWQAAEPASHSFYIPSLTHEPPSHTLYIPSLTHEPPSRWATLFVYLLCVASFYRVFTYLPWLTSRRATLFISFPDSRAAEPHFCVLPRSIKSHWRAAEPALKKDRASKVALHSVVAPAMM